MEVVPVLIVVFFLMIGGSSAGVNAQDKANLRSEQGVTATANYEDVHVNSSSYDANLEYKTILTYITQRYPKVPKQDAEQITTELVDYGATHQLDPKLIAALMAKESSFNKNAISSTGAKGLGQIKSFNYPSLGITDPFNIKQNISGTYQYMRELLGFWKDDDERLKMALASYFKGPNAMKRAKGQMDSSTNHYVTTVMKYYQEIKAIEQ